MTGTLVSKLEGPQESDFKVIVPLILRGEVFVDHLVEYPTRRGGASFAAPDVKAYLGQLPAAGPGSLMDLYELSFEEIVEFLAELGPLLDFRKNEYLNQAFELSRITSGMPTPVLERVYGMMPGVFAPEAIRDVADSVVGIPYLEGWVRTELSDGGGFSVRAFGPRMVNILAGNLPLSGAGGLLRASVLRSDVILKAPSNDPATAAAIVRTMRDLAPDHPVTCHVSVAYWRGGDSEIEDVLYDPSRIEKIFATGGEASMRHIRKYLRPGLDLIAADPKTSATFIGRGTLDTNAKLEDAAERLARDIGVFNQEACSCARIVYVESGTDSDGIELIRRFGRLVYAAIMGLPPELSSPVENFDPELRDALDSLSLSEEWFELIGGEGNEGAIVVSLLEETVDFCDQLGGRTANLVPVDSLEGALDFITNYTQTIGVYPPEIKVELRDRMAICGAQRIVTLGHATDFNYATPQDGMEPMRRLCKWVVDQDGPDTDIQ